MFTGAGKTGGAVVAATDPYFNGTTLLLHGDGTNGANNNTFLDSSDLNGTVPFADAYSNYFGSGNYLTLTSNAAFSFGTGDFTIEFWVNPTAAFSTTRWFSTYTNGIAIYPNNSGNIIVDAYGVATKVTTSSTVSINTWTHVAVVRLSGTTTVYINGVSGGSASDTTNYTNSGVYIGSDNGTNSYTGYMSNLRIVKGTAVYTTAFTPPTTALTAITGTSLLTCQSPRFVDNSTNGFTLSLTGAPSITYPYIYHPFANTYSNYFNGSTDFIQTPNNTALNLGTGNFTLEFYTYVSSIASANYFITRQSSSSGWGNIQWYLNTDTAGTLLLVVSTGVGNGNFWASPTGIIKANNWYHIAIVRSSGTWYLYLNGISQTLANGSNYSSSMELNATGQPLNIGGFTGWGFTNGFISNLRLTKSVVYSSNFTPSTTPLTAITNTVLLTCQSLTFVDNSINALSFTKNGSPTTTNGPQNPSKSGTPTQGTFSPFSQTGWSYYNGSSSNQIMSYPTGTFNYYGGKTTVECWVFPTNLTGGTSGVYPIISNQDSSGSPGQINIGLYSADGKIYNLYIYSTADNNVTYSTLSGNIAQWSHVCIQIDCTTPSTTNQIVFSINGVSETKTKNFSTMTSTSYPGTAIYVGGDGYYQGYYQGYMSNLRIVKTSSYVYGTSSFTPPTSPLTAIAGTVLLTCQSNRFVDNSSSPKTLTLGGGPPSVQPFGPFAPTAAYAANTVGGSIYFNGSSDYLNVPTNIPFAFGTGDFTIEAWIYTSSASTQRIISSSGGVGDFLLVNSGSNAYLNWFDGVDHTTGTNYITLNAWNHVAVSRSGTSGKIFINGVVSGTFTSSTSVNPSSTYSYIGTYGPAPQNYFSGYISNLRIIKGTALYTSAFTPPTAPVTAVTNTSLLLNGTNAGIYDQTTKNNFTVSGSAQISTAQSKFGTGSLFFSSANLSDGLTSISSKNFAFGTGDFTVEFWVRSTTAAQNIIWCTSSWSILVISGNIYWQTVQGVSSLYYRSHATAGLLDGNWHHVAVTRSSGTNRMFIDGKMYSYYAATQGVDPPATDSADYQGTVLNIGKNGVYGWFNGYLDDIRITKGYARYTTSTNTLDTQIFTPPTQTFADR